MDKKVKNFLTTTLTAMSILALFTTLQRQPSAKASTITPEFSDPLGDTTSYSFEGPRETSMFTPPPGWNATSGQRFLETDPNDDGKCEIRDLARVSGAFGSYGPDYLYPGSPPHPRWNPLCDFNKDGKIDIKDLAPTSGNFGKVSQALDGTRSWLMGGAGDNYLMRKVENSCIPYLASEGPRFTFAFYFLSDRLFAVDGAVQARLTFTYSNGTIEDYAGIWTVPMGNWTVAYTVGCIRYEGLTSAKATIKTRDILAYIDYATISRYEGWVTHGLCGSIGCSTNVLFYKHVPGTYDGLLRFVPSLYLEAKEGYKVRSFTLKVTCIMADGDYNLNVLDATQANNKGYRIKPAAEEQYANNRLVAAGLIIPAVVGVTLTFAVGATLTAAIGQVISVITRAAVTTTFGYVLKSAFRYIDTDFDHPRATGGGDNAVWEVWPLDPVMPECCIDNASAVAEVDWAFNTRGGPNTFILFVEASVCFAVPYLLCYVEARPVYIWIDKETCTNGCYVYISA